MTQRPGVVETGTGEGNLGKKEKKILHVMCAKWKWGSTVWYAL
jgi:hypothetical protein